MKNRKTYEHRNSEIKTCRKPKCLTNKSTTFSNVKIKLNILLYLELNV